MRDLTIGLLPQLWSRGAVVTERIVGIGKLVQCLALALGDHGVGQVSGRLHATFLADLDQLRTVGCHRLLTLTRRTLRHDQNHAIALHRGHHRQGDTRVAGGRLDQGVSRGNIAAPLGFVEHRQRRPILDRPRRVVAFQLGQQHIVATCGDSLEPNQRRMTHQLFEIGEIHHAFLVTSSAAIISTPLATGQACSLGVTWNVRRDGFPPRHACNSARTVP